MSIYMPDDPHGDLQPGDVFALRLQDETLILYRVSSQCGADTTVACIGTKADGPDTEQAMSGYSVRSQLRKALRRYVTERGAPSVVSLSVLALYGGPDPALARAGSLTKCAVNRVYYAVPGHNAAYRASDDCFEIWPQAKP